jgi:hypothetical protein
MVQQRVPLTGPKRDAAILAMEVPGFHERLTIRIMKLAADKGFYNPFDDSDVDLPGGESAAGLAVTIIEKALDGTYTWDIQKFPDFYRFCWSRAESILSNWLDKHRRVTTESPIEEEGEDGGLALTDVNQARDHFDLYEILRLRDGGKLGDQLLEDFALSLIHDHDQRIVMAVHDDRMCLRRGYCMGKLSLSERDYDAAMKRIKRAGQDFLPVWCQKNNIKGEEQKEVR